MDCRKRCAGVKLINKMKFFDKCRNAIEKAKNISQKDLEAYRYTIIFIIVVDLFGVFWYLKLKSLAMAILIVCIIFLCLILILERNKQDDSRQDSKQTKNKQNGGNKKMEEPQEQMPKETEEVQEDTSQLEGIGEFDLGLPDADEYQKRAEKALGTIDF